MHFGTLSVSFQSGYGTELTVAYKYLQEKAHTMEADPIYVTEQAKQHWRWCREGKFTDFNIKVGDKR